MNGAAPLAMSLCERIAVSSSLPTTWPPPSVAGPPTNSNARAGVLETEDASSVAATDTAVPVHLAGLQSGRALNESRESSSSTDVSWNSQSARGTRNLDWCPVDAAAA